MENVHQHETTNVRLKPRFPGHLGVLKTWHNAHYWIRGPAVIAYALLICANTAQANHILPLTGIRIHGVLWQPTEPDGWLEFVTNPNTDFGFGEEKVGWIDAFGALTVGLDDHDYGDRAEFDFVFDDRRQLGFADNHPPPTDWLTWSAGRTATSTDHRGHDHKGLPSLVNDDWVGTFTGVDVFSLMFPDETDTAEGENIHQALDFLLMGWNQNLRRFREGTLTDI